MDNNRYAALAKLEALEEEFEDVFKPLGIVAYSNCCHAGCSGAYNEDDPTSSSERKASTLSGCTWTA
jgi:hypothetical protein